MPGKYKGALERGEDEVTRVGGQIWHESQREIRTQQGLNQDGGAGWGRFYQTYI